MDHAQPARKLILVTPVYPAFNSTHNVSLATKEVLVQEFKR